MIPELGHFALVLALVLAIVQGVGAPGWRPDGHRFLGSAGQTGGALQFLFMLLSFVGLTLPFCTNDFSVLYVAQNSNTALPTMY